MEVQQQEKGFGALEAFLILLIIIIIAGVGVYVYRKDHKTTVSKTPAVVSSTGPITFTTFQSKMGLSTGTQLWNSNASDMDTQLAGIAATGAKWVRTAVHWGDIEPSNANQDDWSKADLLVADAQKDGLSIIMDVDGAPNWAGLQQTGEYGSSPQAYATFVAKVAARYADKVRVFELGNEPNSSSYVNTPSAATYADILKAAYPAIKKADPNAFVLTAGLGGGDTKINIDADTYLTGLYQNGAGHDFDALSFHPYTYPMLPSDEVNTGGRGWSKMIAARSIMDKNGDSSKQIWVTEFGAPTKGQGSVSQTQQAAILTNGFNLWKTYSWGGVMSWFDYQDKSNDDATSHKGSLGLVDTTGAHKLSYAAYVALTKN